MQKLHFIFEYSPLLLVPGLLLALAYGGFMYYKYKAPWGINFSIALAILRSLTTFLVFILLFGPLLRSTKFEQLPSKAIILIDNSVSMVANDPQNDASRLNNLVQQLRQNTESRGYETFIQTLEGDVNQEDIIDFDEQETNITQALNNIRRVYEGETLTDVYLISDGIYNRGNNPSYQAYPFRVHTIAIGDTVTKPDLGIDFVMHNKAAYLGNKFPILVEYNATSMAGNTTQISVRYKGTTLVTETVKIESENYAGQAKFELDASEAGMRHYQVIIQPNDSEQNKENNIKDFFIEVIEGKDKVLLASPYPHPDIKAIRNTLLKNQNYETQTYIPGISELKNEDYGVAIVFNITNASTDFINKVTELKAKNVPIWYVTGTGFNTAPFNKLSESVNISPLGRRTDMVFPHNSPGFESFKLSKESEDIIPEFTPVQVPFANFEVLNKTDVLLYQQVGSVQTSKPLLTYYKADKIKEAVFIGSGLWQWPLAEYQENNQHQAFDEIITKMVRLLVTRDDNRKFKVYPIKKQFGANEPVVFEAELYNDIYENVYGFEVSLTISNDTSSRNYQYTAHELGSTYSINNLQEGVYKYTASTTFNGQDYTDAGGFAVTPSQLELNDLTADFNLLRQISANNGGTFTDSVAPDNLEIKEAKSILREYENYSALLDLAWILAAILLLVSLEWFLRKYLGAY